MKISRIKLLKLLLYPFRSLFGRGFGNVRLLATAFRIFVRLFIPKQYIIAKANDCRLGMVIGGDRGFDSLASGLILGKGYEVQATKLFKELVKPRMTVVDVGAHIGYYTLLALKLVGNKGRVLAFEPEPRNYDNLVKNLVRNTGTDEFTNVVVLQKAVSNKNGREKLFISDNSSGECSLVEMESRPKITIDVGTVVLDRVLGDMPVDVIKVDVEGGEMEVLLGAEKLISRNQGIKIFIEFLKLGLEGAGYSCMDYWSKLKQYGFNYIYLIDERKRKVKRTDCGSVQDYVCKAGGVNLLCSKEEVLI